MKTQARLSPAPLNLIDVARRLKAIERQADDISRFAHKHPNIVTAGFICAGLLASRRAASKATLVFCFPPSWGKLASLACSEARQSEGVRKAARWLALSFRRASHVD